MTHWRLVPVSDEPQPTDLTDSELVGVSIMLTHGAGDTDYETNVYWRAREKIQPQVQVALKALKA